MTVSDAPSGTACRYTETLLAAHGIGRLPVPAPGANWSAVDPAPVPETWGEMSPPDDGESRALYRWLLGHHGAVGVWRMLGDTLSRLVEEPSSDRLRDVAAGLYDCYSALLVYAGSCTPGIYERAVRDRMVAAHPAFSGIWARDYEWVLGLLVRMPALPGSTLKQAVLRNRQVHMAIAKRLVPNDDSLLKKAGRRANQGATAEERDLFDEFFVLERGPTSRARFLAHVAQRVSAIETDLDRYPLEPTSGLHLLLPADMSTLVRSIAADPSWETP
ncbi:hypothetical protein [Lentzea sp. NPDC059081]|uniref:hypothetical protein n=1 Tax=Lentzea sp. NPDC059081 TaxID=3346719 RepID=UPI00369418E7